MTLGAMAGDITPTLFTGLEGGWRNTNILPKQTTQDDQKPQSQHQRNHKHHWNARDEGIWLRS